MDLLKEYEIPEKSVQVTFFSDGLKNFAASDKMTGDNSVFREAKGTFFSDSFSCVFASCLFR